MSLCDQCKQPGACCRDMVISSNQWAGTVWQDNWKSRAEQDLAEKLPGHPFVVHRYEAVDPPHPAAYGRPYGLVHWSCPRLQPDGRCGDYENRPQLCRDYEPASDRLCVMYVPPAVESMLKD